MQNWSGCVAVAVHELLCVPLLVSVSTGRLQLDRGLESAVPEPSPQQLPVFSVAPQKLDSSWLPARLESSEEPQQKLAMLGFLATLRARHVHKD